VIVDYHMHLRNEREEIAHDTWSVDPFVEAACAAGVDEIGFTEHVYYFKQTRTLWTVPYQAERCVYDLESYVDAIAQARARGPPAKLAEVDYVPGREEETRRCSRRTLGLSVRLGALHRRFAFDASCACTTSWRRGRVAVLLTPRGRARSGLFDGSHPDLVKVFGDGSDFDYGPIADAIAESSVAVEVSTAPVGELYPHPDLSRPGRSGVRGRMPPRTSSGATSTAPRAAARRGAETVRCSTATRARSRSRNLRVASASMRTQPRMEPAPLGGARSTPRGLAGHSDGTWSRMLIDAVLGAAGLRHWSLFPSDGSTPEGISSLDPLRDAVAQVREAGYSVVNADCVPENSRDRGTSRGARAGATHPSPRP
jgi:histidinol-phosphatase (PHP family)